MIQPVESYHLERFRVLISARLGLHMEVNKLPMAADMLGQQCTASGMDPHVYLDRIEEESTSGARWKTLTQLLTVTETYFLRHQEQLAAYVDLLRDDRLRRSTTGGTSVLCAGCASGEEPYSVAILSRDVIPDAEEGPAILGVDVNPAMIAKAKEARYTEWSLRGMPDAHRERCFIRDGAHYTLRPEYRKGVEFELLNLSEDRSDFWTAGRFDTVFCRNTVMYFTPAHARNLMQRIAHALVPGGYLFLGHAESLRGLSQDFDLISVRGAFVYRRKTGTRNPPAFPAQVALEVLWPPPSQLDQGWADEWVSGIARSSQRIRDLSESSQRDARHSGELGGTTEPQVGAAAALELLRKERFQDALNALGVEQTDADRAPENKLLLAILLVHVGRTNEAEKVCERLLDLDGLNPGAHYILALCRESDGDPFGAIERDRVAVHLDPSFAMPCLHLGLMARRIADHRTARDAIVKAMELLEHEDSDRLAMFGGGFSRSVLVSLCRSELAAL